MTDKLELEDIDGDGIPDVVKINIRWMVVSIWCGVTTCLGAIVAAVI